MSDSDAVLFKKRAHEDNDGEASRQIVQLEAEKDSLQSSYDSLEKIVKATEAQIELVRSELKQYTQVEDAEPAKAVKVEGPKDTLEKSLNDAELRSLRQRNTELLKAVATANKTSELLRLRSQLCKMR